MHVLSPEGCVTNGWGSYLRQGLNGDKVLGPPVQHALVQLVLLRVLPALLPLLLLAFSIIILDFFFFYLKILLL